MNIVDLLGSYKSVVKNNQDISTLYIIYQVFKNFKILKTWFYFLTLPGNVDGQYICWTRSDFPDPGRIL